MFYTIDNRMVNDFFDDLDTIFTSSGRKPTKHKSKNYKTDSDENGVALTMEIPGYNKDMVSIDVSGDDLIIEGKPHTGNTEGFIQKFCDLVLKNNQNIFFILDMVIDAEFEDMN